MLFETIETERLTLRKLTDDVYRSIFNNHSDNEIKQLFGIGTDEDLKVETEKVKKGLSTFNKTFLYFHLIDKQTNNIIGWCGYHTWYLDHFRAEIGYGLFDEAVKAKGIMTEALKPIIQYGFETMKLNRIEAFLSPDNIPSLKLVQKFGFTKEGHLREHYNKDNKLEDSVVFSLLKSEYKAID
ncbi:putative ribosomal N-acetyltransferase YdaF [compost metagenome]